MLKTIFYATVGEDLTVKFLNVAKVKTHLLPLRGQTVEITIEKRRKRRTNSQNSYYWGVVIKMICETCGYRTAEEQAGVHAELKNKFLPKVGRLKIAKSTSSLNTAEFNQYIEDVRRWAAEELGIYIPDANEAKEE